MPFDDGIHFTINKFCLSCGTEPCRFIHPPAEKPSHVEPGKHRRSGPQAEGKCAAGEDEDIANYVAPRMPKSSRVVGYVHHAPPAGVPDDSAAMPGDLFDLVEYYEAHADDKVRLGRVAWCIRQVMAGVDEPGVDKAEGVPQNSSANPDTGGEPPPNRPPARRSHE